MGTMKEIDDEIMKDESEIEKVESKAEESTELVKAESTELAESKSESGTDIATVSEKSADLTSTGTSTEATEPSKKKLFIIIGNTIIFCCFRPFFKLRFYCI